MLKLRQSLATFAIVVGLNGLSWGQLPMVLAASVEGTMWKLVGWGNPAQLTPVLENSEITLSFSDDRLAGSSGCNNYTGGYTLNETQIEVGAIASTRKACLTPIMTQELSFLTGLQEAETLKINDNGQLEVEYMTPQGSGVLVFEKQEESPQSWLDMSQPTTWNQAGADIPRPEDKGENLESCRATARKPVTPEDKALVNAGWTLFGAVQVYGDTQVISAMSDADGMCRPWGYQEFVFVDGKFAGTLSPEPMNSRTDGSARNLDLWGENKITAEFNRYSEQDALCCPSGTSYVTYEIKPVRGMMVVVPTDISSSSR